MCIGIIPIFFKLPSQYKVISCIAMDIGMIPELIILKKRYCLYTENIQAYVVVKYDRY